jgi:UbiD family decarboxylase
VPFRDLREFIDSVEKLDRLERIDGAHWDLEIGGITELTVRRPDAPALLFDQIPGSPPGYRVMSNVVNSRRRAALALDMPADAEPLELTRMWKERIRHIEPIAPRTVEWGPVMENVQEGDDVDLLKFPSPKWHELDGGRYIGTADMVIQRDVDDPEWVNAGTYRIQVHDHNTLGIYISSGHHGTILRQKYWDRGEPCPVVVTVGQEPGLWIACTHAIPAGQSELDYAGWLRGEPVEVIAGEYTGLPIPATAEIAFEGDLLPPEHESRVEGPFGEWQGYYGTGAAVEPVIKVRRVLHRNDPIIFGAPPLKPLATFNAQVGIDFGSARIWHSLEAAGVPDVRGVYRFIAGQTSGYFVVISITQRYPGHSREAAHVALGAYAASHNARFVVVVDDDIDPSNPDEVLWAMGTRCDPSTSMEIAHGLLGTNLDPRVEPAAKRAGNAISGRAIIDACRPFHWKDEFPPVSEMSAELRASITEKWGARLL